MKKITSAMNWPLRWKIWVSDKQLCEAQRERRLWLSETAEAVVLVMNLFACKFMNVILLSFDNRKEIGYEFPSCFRTLAGVH